MFKEKQTPIFAEFTNGGEFTINLTATLLENDGEFDLRLVLLLPREQRTTTTRMCQSHDLSFRPDCHITSSTYSFKQKPFTSNL